MGRKNNCFKEQESALSGRLVLVGKGGASVRSCANVTYSVMQLLCGDAVKWRPPFLQQRLQSGLCNSSGQEEEEDMVLCMHGENSMWVSSMALTLHKVVTYR